jgi:ABC-type nitrate/sulfonate/bicarbonate transport system permease component
MKKNRRFVSMLRGVLLVVALWWGVSLLAGERIVPAPPAVFITFFRLLRRGLPGHIGSTFLRAVAAIVAATVTAVPTAILMGRRRGADRFLSPAAYLLYPVPKIALLPVAFLLFGLGNATRVFVVALVLFFPILLTVRDAVKSIDEGYFISLRSLGARPKHLFRFVIIPALLPRLFTALRIGAGTALAVLFFAETFFTRRGLGYLIVESWTRVAYDQMFAGIVAMGLLGLVLFGAIDLLQRRLCRWEEGGRP